MIFFSVGFINLVDLWVPQPAFYTFAYLGLLFSGFLHAALQHVCYLDLFICFLTSDMVSRQILRHSCTDGLLQATCPDNHNHIAFISQEID